MSSHIITCPLWRILLCGFSVVACPRTCYLIASAPLGFQSISTHADHCHQDESAETKDDSEDAEGEDKDEGGEDGGDEEGGEGGEEEEEEEAEEEEDDEEEIVDPKETLEEGSSFALAPYLSTPERVR